MSSYELNVFFSFHWKPLKKIMTHCYQRNHNLWVKNWAFHISWKKDSHFTQKSYLFSISRGENKAIYGSQKRPLPALVDALVVQRMSDVMEQPCPGALPLTCKYGWKEKRQYLVNFYSKSNFTKYESWGQKGWHFFLGENKMKRLDRVKFSVIPFQ